MFALNGKTYVAKKRKRVKPDPKVKELLYTYEYLLASMPDELGIFKKPGSIRMPDCDIIKEYGLIELKKSKLSSRHRSMVVKSFENAYKETTESQLNNLISIDNHNQSEYPLDSGSCSEWGWSGLLNGLEIDQEIGDYGSVLSSWPLCPVCEDGGCIDDYYSSKRGKEDDEC